MAQKHVAVLFFSQHLLRVGILKNGATPVFERGLEYEWSEDNLAKVLNHVKNECSLDSVRVVLGADIGYLVTVVQPASDTSDAPTYIQELLRTTPSFQQSEDKIQSIVELARTPDGIVQQAVVAKHTLLDTLRLHATNAGIRFAHIEPAPYALARTTANREQPHAIIHWDRGVWILIAHKGKTYGADVTKEEDVVKTYTDLKAYVQSQCGIHPASIIASRLPDDVRASLNDLGVPVVDFDCSVYIGSAGYNVQDGEELEEDVQVEQAAKRSISKRMILAIGAVPVIAAAVVVGVLVLKKPNAAPDVTQAATPTVAETVAPTPIPPSLDTIKVQVLNGSGTAGEAGKVVDELKSKGFTQFETGNAETYDYTETVIQKKANIPESVVYAIREAITDYALASEVQSIPEHSTPDVIIVVGSEKN